MAHTLTVTGSVTLASLDRIERELAPALMQDDVMIDLSAVDHVDSSAVSLLLHWQRAALAAGRKLGFCCPPASLISLARLYGVEEFLALQH